MDFLPYVGAQSVREGKDLELESREDHELTRAEVEGIPLKGCRKKVGCQPSKRQKKLRLTLVNCSFFRDAKSVQQ